MKKLLATVLVACIMQSSVLASETTFKEKVINGAGAVKDAVIFILEIPLMVIAFPLAYAMFSNDNPNK